MQMFKGFIKISGAFVLISAMMLYLPAILFRKDTSPVLSALPGYEDADDNILGTQTDNSELQTSTPSSDDSGCNCGNSSYDYDLTVDTRETENESDSDQELRNDCVLSKEVHTSEYDVYQADGIVYIDIIRDTDSAFEGAYRFLRSQGCVLADSNLEWIY